MKKTVLSYEGGITWGTARVRFTPNWLERRFGYKLDINEYKWEGTTYGIGGERKWYCNDTGTVYGRFPQIDNYIRQRKYNRENSEMVVNNITPYVDSMNALASSWKAMLNNNKFR